MPNITTTRRGTAPRRLLNLENVTRLIERNPLAVTGVLQAITAGLQAYVDDSDPDEWITQASDRMLGDLRQLPTMAPPARRAVRR